MLTSFPDPLHVAVFGASGGIGSALVSLLSACERVSCVHAFARQPVPAGDRIVPGVVDLQDEASIERAAEQTASHGPLHLVIVATGMLHGATPPEKSWRALTAASLAESFAINSIGPALIAKHFLERLAPQEKSVLALLSARVGSIEDNQLGGWHGYRASKAALNMLMRNFAIELRRRNPAGICVSLHPGTVDTALSKPFQANVSEHKLFTPTQAAHHLLKVIDQLDVTSSGQMFAWDGQRIPF